MKKIYFKLFFACTLTFYSCQNSQSPKEQNIQETPEYKKLSAENDSLKKVLGTFMKEQQKIKASSKGLAYNGQISIVKIETGFDPYHNSSNLWLPCVTIKFKNISNEDIKDFVNVTAIFIDNAKEEQIGTDYVYLATSSRLLLSGTTKQISLSSSIGWYTLQNQSVTVKIYVNDDLVKTLSVERKEFDGMIR